MRIEGMPEWQITQVVTAPGAAGALPESGGVEKLGFEKILLNGMEAINTKQIESHQQVLDYLQGKGPDLHTVMLNVEQANLAVEFAVQMRNKIIDAYNEVMRMQV
jgi:flagellar hook-basal body complex protein FliE